jgi:hypothetical protein
MLTFLKFFYNMGVMEGLTITEIARLLRITPEAAKLRLYRAGITPITKEALYDPACVDQIREVSKGGRPRKAASPADEKDGN